MAYSVLPLPSSLQNFLLSGGKLYSDLLWSDSIGVTLSPLGNLIANVGAILSAVMILLLALHLCCDAWFAFRSKFGLWLQD